MKYYSKKKISQEKINKIIPEQDKYYNLETWEVLDLTTEELFEDKKTKLIKLNYKFIMINKEILYK